MSTFGDGAYETDQQLDGDGRRIKSTLKNYDPNTDQWMTEKITYYIHSSILGEVISEVSAQGAKERSFVFAGGKVMAIQDWEEELFADPQETTMDIARRKNCATPNSIVEQFKNDFEAQWRRTTQSGEENGSLLFYERATNTYPKVALSEGRHLTDRITSVPALPEIGPETRKSICRFWASWTKCVFPCLLPHSP